MENYKVWQKQTRYFVLIVVIEPDREQRQEEALIDVRGPKLRFVP